MTQLEVIDSPIGYLQIKEGVHGLEEIKFLSFEVEASDSPRTETGKQLIEYFAGKRREFDLVLAPEGSDFQKEVWNELVGVPFGKTLSYAEVAERLGNPKVIRAAANANGKNPIPIVIPCHRILGSDGSLTGYSGGLEKKKWLLKHEGCWRQTSMF